MSTLGYQTWIVRAFLSNMHRCSFFGVLHDVLVSASTAPDSRCQPGLIHQVLALPGLGRFEFSEILGKCGGYTLCTCVKSLERVGSFHRLIVLANVVDNMW